MKITAKDVEHIASLARLETTEGERDKFAGQLSEILSYVEVLNEVPTENVNITTQVTGLENISREDQVKKGEPSNEELLKCSPNPVELNQIRVQGAIQK